MNRKTFIDKLKTMFSEVEENVVEDKFVDVITIDGIVLRIREEEIKEGVQVYVVGEDGSEVPAPEGEHSIEGKVIVTDAEGKVLEVKEVESEESEEEKEAEPEVEVEAQKECKCKGEENCECDKYESELSSDIQVQEVPVKSELELRLEVLENSIANLSESMSAIDNLQKVVSEIAQLPADEEVKLSKADNDKTKIKNSREDKLNFFSKR
jgi:hypothetical protein